MSEDDLRSPIGSSFESFLEEEGFLDEVDELSIKKVIAASAGREGVRSPRSSETKTAM